MTDIIFDSEIFDSEIFDVTVSTAFLRRLLDKMEKKNIGSYCFEAGCVEPGVDNVDTPLRRVLDKLEKSVRDDGSMWAEGQWESGQWEHDTTLQQVLSKLEK